MKCSCCGQKRRLSQSYERLSDELHVCVQCSTLLYKLRDAIKDGDSTLVAILSKELDSKSSTDAFRSWKKERLRDWTSKQ